MTPFEPKRTRKDGPEGLIQDRLIKKLKSFDWFVLPTHGNAYQHGFPDLYCLHPKWNSRWIEVKNPLSYSFTNAQKQLFPQFQRCGVGIWILCDDTDSEIAKLTQPANWEYYYNCKQLGIKPIL